MTLHFWVDFVMAMSILANFVGLCVSCHRTKYHIQGNYVVWYIFKTFLSWSLWGCLLLPVTTSNLRFCIGYSIVLLFLDVAAFVLYKFRRSITPAANKIVDVVYDSLPFHKHL